MSKSYFKRSRVFVSGMIQGRLIARLAMYWTLYHVALWHAMFLYRYLDYRASLLTGATPISFGELYGTFVFENRSLVICAFVLSPIIFWDILRLTHRVAGPLVRFERTLHEMADGKPVKNIKLRKGDLLIALQDAFNHYLNSRPAVAQNAQVEVFEPADDTPSTELATQQEHLLVELEEVHNVPEDVDAEAQPVGASAGE